LRTIALALMVAGVLIALVPVGIVGYGMWQESQLTQEWAQSARPLIAHQPDAGNQVGLPVGPGIDRGRIVPPFATPQPADAPHPTIPALFAIRVPKIGYYAAVRQGVSLNILAVGPGHYPTTALPGQPGLIGVAAHNTFWIPFGQLGPGDTVILETLTARFTYRITGSRIVNPDDRTVLAATPDSRLVLTTCWPLWAGSLAPQRLALFAQQV
jgi:sortase A